jgi:large conductance mechanosensitive channel protein
MAMSGFKNFIMRGNLVQLAVAVVIGTQFSDLVKQFVLSFIDPLAGVAGQRLGDCSPWNAAALACAPR